MVPAKPVLHKVTEERYWPNDGVMPSLARFVGPKSWLIFKALNLSDAKLDWLKFRSCEWEKFSYFVTLRFCQEIIHDVHNPP